DKLSQEVGYTLPSGAGAKSDQIAAKLLQAYGDQALQATAKYHFANTKKAYQRLK
ncbi:MAG: ribonuclease HIII, partial [Streptococcus salivarius]